MIRPETLQRPRRLLRALIGALRSATFLSTFVASYYFAVCFTRTLVLAKCLPFVSHNFWDGPSGCMLTGALVCGSSIWIENGKRRGEMALYVLPKALRACLPDRWLKTGKSLRVIEWCAITLIHYFFLILSTGSSPCFQFHHYSQQLSTVLSHCVVSLDGLCHLSPMVPTPDFGSAGLTIRAFRQPLVLLPTLTNLIYQNQSFIPAIVYHRRNVDIHISLDLS